MQQRHLCSGERVYNEEMTTAFSRGSKMADDESDGDCPDPAKRPYRVGLSSSCTFLSAESPRDDDAERFGTVLCSVAPIVERVLTHLPMRDLNRCAQVCRFWAEIARQVKRRRSQLSWLFWAAQRNKKLPPSVCSSCSIAEHIKHVLETASSEPKLGLLFATHTFIEVQSELIGAEQTHKTSSSDMPVIDHLVSSLPRECQLFGVCSYGMVGTTLGEGVHQCVEVEMAEGFSCLLLPNLPGVELHPFIIKNATDLELEYKQWAMTDEELHRLTNLPMGKEVKCLLLFCTHLDRGYDGARLVTTTLLQRQGFRMAVGGGVVDSFVAPEGQLEGHPYLPHTMGIAICGERVRAASVILDRGVRRKKAVDKAMARLKACNFPLRNSFGFMFACTGRGRDHYGEPNVEADAFQASFPQTPLFGFFGSGEIGLNFTPSCGVQGSGGGGTAAAGASGARSGRKKYSFRLPPPSERKAVDGVDLFHSYTTAVVLVAVDKP